MRIPLIVKRVTLRALVSLAVLSGVGCATVLKPPVPEAPTSALSPVNSGELARLSATARRQFGPSKSAFELLDDNQAALGWRLALVDHAQRSIDIQYYLWSNDEAGNLMLDRLLDAADRGVRVRILVDDFLFDGNIENIAAASHHPNFEIRLFNPKSLRGGTLTMALEYMFNFEELNPRMHNKLFIADNRVAIFGGRNIGNQYFGLSKNYNFSDLDVVAVGPVVTDSSQAFDVFWNSDSAYPGRQLAEGYGPEDADRVIAAFRDKFAEEHAGDDDILARSNYPLKRRDWTKQLRGIPNRWHSGEAIVVQDSPEVTPGEERERFLDTAPRIVDQDNPKEVLVVSPYLLPGEDIYESIERYTEMGAEVKVLTGSLGANNHLMVHSHYRKHRRNILRNGASLYEFRWDPTDELRERFDAPPNRSKYIAMHTKTFVGDGVNCYIGSLNLDPRSIVINSENGLFIRSPGLVADLTEYVDSLMADENAWHLTTEKPNGEGQIYWDSRGERLTMQPARKTSQRFMDFFFGLLPIESQL